jgi:hypothetical protein
MVSKSLYGHGGNEPAGDESAVNEVTSVRGVEERVRQIGGAETRSFNGVRSMVTAALALALVACASNPVNAPGYDGFLNTIAAECKPLVIGSDNLGQAIVFNGVGADPENYTNFLGSTSALYSGSISPAMYQDTLTAFLGSGTANQRSFDCIFAHLRQVRTVPPAPSVPGK